MKKLPAILYSTLLVALTAVCAGFFTRSGISFWYSATPRPFLTPPDSVFPVVWTLLYLCLVISFSLILIQTPKQENKSSQTLFIIQLFLQIAWCFAFFYKGWLGVGFIVILLLDYCVFQMINNFSSRNKYAAWILYPYFWWLAFATFLTFNYTYYYGLNVVF